MKDDHHSREWDSSCLKTSQRTDDKCRKKLTYQLPLRSTTKLIDRSDPRLGSMSELLRRTHCNLFRIIQPIFNNGNLAVPCKEYVSHCGGADYISCARKPVIRHEEVSGVPNWWRGWPFRCWSRHGEFVKVFEINGADPGV